MPGLSFSNQNQPKRPGGWILPVVLVVISIVMLTVSARMGNSGAFGAVRNVVHAAAAPMQQACSVISTPFKSIGSGPSAPASTEDVSALQQENTELKVLVSQLEEYRQQDQRLTALMSLSDTYALQTVSGNIVSVSSGWEQTATINVGSDSGVQIGMGVMSSCGLYGQVESVNSNSATVRLISDAHSSVSALVQGTRATGIVTGSYDGTLTMSYVSAKTTVGEGDVIVTSGSGGTYPRGIILGTVSSVEKDSSKLYYNLTVNPLFDFHTCEEVLVLTGNEDATKSLVDNEKLQTILTESGQASNADTSAKTDSKSNDSKSGSSSKDTKSSSKGSSKDSSKDDTGDSTSGKGQ